MKNKRNKIANLFKIGILLFGVSLLLWNCEKEENLPPQQNQKEEFSSLDINQLVYDKDFKDFNNIISFQQEGNLNDKTLILAKQDKHQAKNEEQQIAIFNQVVKKFKKDNYISYTFKLDLYDEDFPSSFYNLVLQNNNGKTEAYTLKYYPDEGWNPTQQFQGEMDIRYGISNFSDCGMAIPMKPSSITSSKEEPCNESGAGGNSGDYVKVCEQKVVKIAIPCPCEGHTPNQHCTCSSKPYYSLDYEEVCHWEYDNGDYQSPDNGDPNSSSGGGGGSSTSTDPDNINTTIISHILPEGAEFLPFHLNLTQEEIDFINKDENSQLKNSLEVFIYDNKYSTQAKNFAKGQIQLEQETQNISWKSSTGILENNPNLKFTHVYHDLGKSTSYYKLTDGAIVAASSYEKVLTSAGELTNKYRDNAGMSQNDRFYYIKLSENGLWAEMLFNPRNHSDELKTLFALAGKELGKSIGRYVLPIEDIKILIDGKDFDGQKVARWKAAGFLILAVVPGSKALKVVANASEAIAVAVKIGSNTLVVDTVKAGLKVVSDSNVIKFLSQTGDEIARVVDGVMTFNYRGFGGAIITNPNKTTTLIGRWDDLKHIWNTGLAKHGSNKGGINILGEPFGSNVTEIWANNKIWLDRAITRGDNIRATANPLDINNVFYNSSGIDPTKFSDINILKDYLLNLSSVKVEQLGYYGREIRHLFQNGYSFNSTTKQFIK